MIKKSVFMSVLLVILTFSLVGGSTAAYFTDTQSPSANISTGHAAITVKVTKQGSKEKGGPSKDLAEVEESDFQIECTPDCTPDCDPIKDKVYYVQWTITNKSTMPVTLQANLSPEWERIAEKSSSSPTPKILLPKSVGGWTKSTKGASKGSYLYTKGSKGKKLTQTAVKPEKSVTFDVKFRVDNNGAVLDNFKLNLTLNVLATQVESSADHTVMAMDESLDDQDEQNPSS